MKTANEMDLDRMKQGKGTVLLVDDEDTALEVGRELLENLGYRTYVARDGLEAVEIYTEKGESIDLVLLDLFMPNVDGAQAFDRLKEIDPQVRVLLSSGYGLEGEAKEVFERGCKGFIQKPFRLRDLSGAIEHILEEGETRP